LLKGAASVAVAVLSLGGLMLGAAPASAAVYGPGYDIGNGFLGSYQTEAGVNAYCVDLGSNAQFATSPPPQTVTSLNGLSAQDLAELNYVYGKWGPTQDNNIAAAVALYSWWKSDNALYESNGGDDHYVQRVPSSVQGTVLADLATMRSEAAADAVVVPSASVSISMTDQYAGTVTVQTSPGDITGTLSLSDAQFAAGGTSMTAGAGTYAITGTPPAGAASYAIGASAAFSATGLGARVDLYSVPDTQRIAAAGTSGGVHASATTPQIPLDFQPTITTQVASQFVPKGDPVVDDLTVGVSKGSWIVLNGTQVPVTAVGTLYGPYDEQPDPADVPPANAPVAATTSMVLDHGPGGYPSPSSVIAPASGFYVWVWTISKTAQGDYAQYITGDFADGFGKTTEIPVVPFQPVAVSQTGARLALPGEMVTDTIAVSSANGAWLKLGGTTIPVTFDGTAYAVPGDLPPAQTDTVPADAVVLGSVQVTANGPGTFTSPPVTYTAPGFVTWVWKVLPTSQPVQYRDYIEGDWADKYGVPTESSSVRRSIQVTSLLREYNVVHGGRAFDTITVSGFTADHGQFTGDGYWGADEGDLVSTVYGPFASDTILTDTLNLVNSPVLTRIVTPAQNGTYQLGYTNQDEIAPAQPGYYIVVSSFSGDDRVQPYVSHPSDILERFFVPGGPGPLPKVMTKASGTVVLGQPAHDTATVAGNAATGMSLVFRAYRQTGDQPVCGADNLVADTSKTPVAVTGPGSYTSVDTVFTSAGTYDWVETLVDTAGNVAFQGECGAPGESTVVQPQPQLPETPALAFTGWDAAPFGVGAGSLLGLGAVLLIASRIVRSRARLRKADESKLN
jgi:hypothetical protein